MTDAQASAITGVVADVQSVNAESVVRALLPVLRKIFAKKLELKPVSDVLDILGDDAEKAVQGAVAPLKDEQLEAMIKTLIAAYGNSICKMLNELLTPKGIPVTIDTIELSLSFNDIAYVSAQLQRKERMTRSLLFETSQHT